ncbi:MAG: hypothetical protein AAF899_18815 [Pseudomonadota bacterium]
MSDTPSGTEFGTKGCHGDGDWDFATQQADTAWVCMDLIAKTALSGGETITLDLQFVPGGGDADRAGFVAAMQAAGYSGNAWSDPKSGVETIEAVVPGIAFTFEAIWQQEERLTRIALLFGYRPDGWGFHPPDDA